MGHCFLGWKYYDIFVINLHKDDYKFYGIFSHISSLDLYLYLSVSINLMAESLLSFFVKMLNDQLASSLVIFKFLSYFQITFLHDRNYLFLLIVEVMI